jgi:acyl-CoA reductase-like NAD-dependent aldehyde dehydrogenase
MLTSTRLSTAHRLAKAIRAGCVWVGCYQATDPAVPFGGDKMMDIGAGPGYSMWRNVKAVWIKTA